MKLLRISKASIGRVNHILLKTIIIKVTVFNFVCKILESELIKNGTLFFQLNFYRFPMPNDSKTKV